MFDINPTSLEGLGIFLICVFILGVLMKLFSIYSMRKEIKKEGVKNEYKNKE